MHALFPRTAELAWLRLRTHDPSSALQDMRSAFITTLACYAVLVMVRVSSAQQCKMVETERADKESHLNHGLTHMWTTPILRYHLVKEQHAHLLRAIEAAVLARYESFSSDCTRRQGETSNDVWFGAQRDAWEEGKPSFLEEPGSGAESAMKTLRTAIVSNMREYVANSIGEDTADDYFEDKGELKLFIWASVHKGCSLHTAHVHPETAISGTFYVTAPPGSGTISFDDPRGMRPPFHQNRLVHTPEAGEMILFPPWLVHTVAPSCEAESPRIALSFNLVSSDDGKDKNRDWELLSDASVFMSSDGDEDPQE